MAETSIEWTSGPNGEPGYSFNPVTGCQRVSAGCVNCYAERQNKRWHDGKNWGPGTPRAPRIETYWRQPEKWNNEAMAMGQRRKVFCASNADVFEDHSDWVAPRARLFNLIASTPHLDWLLLTKRPENIKRFLPAFSTTLESPLRPWPNVWLGTTVEDQQRANERIDLLTSVPAVVHFLSVEPLLEPVDLGLDRNGHIEWVIVGGESGPGARPFDVWWAHDIRAQCKKAGVPFFMKQFGTVPIQNEADWRGGPGRLLNASTRKRVPEGCVGLKFTGKGDDIAEFPPELRVREFPTARTA